MTVKTEGSIPLRCLDDGHDRRCPVINDQQKRNGERAAGIFVASENLRIASDIRPGSIGASMAARFETFSQRANRTRKKAFFENIGRLNRMS